MNYYWTFVKALLLLTTRVFLLFIFRSFNGWLTINQLINQLSCRNKAMVTDYSSWLIYIFPSLILVVRRSSNSRKIVRVWILLNQLQPVWHNFLIVSHLSWLKIIYFTFCSFQLILGGLLVYKALRGSNFLRFRTEIKLHILKACNRFSNCKYFVENS